MENVQPISLFFHHGRKEDGYRLVSSYRGSFVGLCRQPLCEYCDLQARGQIEHFRSGRLSVVLTSHQRPSFFEEGGEFFLAHLQAAPAERIEAVLGLDEGLEFDLTGSNAVLIDTGHGSLLIDPGSMGFETRNLSLHQLIRGRRVTTAAITHGHLDHWKDATVLKGGTPIFMTRLTHSLISRHAAFCESDEFLGVLKVAQMATPGEPIIMDRLPLRVKTFSLNHSIPETMGFDIRGKRARAVHLGDFKFYGMEPKSKAELVATLRDIAKERVDILCLNIVNAHVRGFAPIETIAISSITDLLSRPGRVIIVCFSTNLERIRAITEVAQLLKRPVRFYGAGMKNAEELLEIKPETEDGDPVIFATGCQAEEYSVLWRLAQGRRCPLELQPGDTIVFSSRCIPGNEAALKEVISALRSKVGRIIVNKGEASHLGLGDSVTEGYVHISGHGNKEDLRLALQILRPKRALVWPQTPIQIEAFRDIAKPLGIEIIPEKERIIEV